ncbi:MAG: hypothetical protein KKA73_06470 [Chloroflexi bacterium]|nr:hypothetical protein [Chloroflexota bacterium]MBU1747315.1 hypothetical protein [Chloroflexota bacterium]
MGQRSNHPRLTQVLPPPLFQVLPTTTNEWHVVVRDEQSDDAVHYTAPLGTWTLRDVAIAGALTAAGARAIVAVQRIEHGLPIDFDTLAVQLYWGQWLTRSLHRKPAPH